MTTDDPPFKEGDRVRLTPVGRLVLDRVSRVKCCEKRVSFGVIKWVIDFEEGGRDFADRYELATQGGSQCDRSA